MLKIDLPTHQIYEMLTNNNYPYYQQTLIQDSYFHLSIGIFTPQEQKNYKYQIGSFQSLLNTPLWANIIILEVVPIHDNLFFVKHMKISEDNFVHIISTSNMQLFEIHNTIELLHTQEYYVTVMFSKQHLYLAKEFPFVMLTEYSTLPPAVKSISIQSVALIYDPELPNTIEEISFIVKMLEKDFPYIQIGIYATPLTKNQFSEIFNTYHMVHYAGHITQKGFMIDKNLEILPQMIIPPKLVLLNGCALPVEMLNIFFSKEITCLFSTLNQWDFKVPTQDIVIFYKGLLLGYPLKHLCLFSLKHLTLAGYSHTRLTTPLVAI